MRRIVILLAALCALQPAAARAQSDQDGALTGVVTDRAGAARPNAVVVLTREGGPDRSLRATTDERGRFHFAGLPPGRYSIQVDAAGSAQPVVVRLGQRSSVRLSAEPAPPGEQGAVDGRSLPRSADAPFDAPEGLLQRIPSLDRTILLPLELSPAAVPGTLSAYGSSGPAAHAFVLDGADIGDPVDGSPWLRPHQNWIEQSRVAALGAPAREGGFTGVRSATLVKSGTNRFSGLIDSFFQNDALIDENVADATLELRPQLVPRRTEFATDITAQIGGPLRRDTAWFFSGGRFGSREDSITGYPPSILPLVPAAGGGPAQPTTDAYEVIFKPTVNVGQAQRVNGLLLVSRQAIDGAGASDEVTPEATSESRGTAVVWNVSLARPLGSSLLDLRYAGLLGSDDRLPYNGDAPAWYDQDLNVFAVNAPETYRADRDRHQVNAAWSTLLGGAHVIDAGAEFERGHAATAERYTGGRVIVSSLGVPVRALLWDGLAKDSVNTRYSAYLQDSWLAAARLTIDAGARIDRITGTLSHLDDQVLATTTFSPRVGAVYDLTGTGRTLLRAHYGWYADGPKAAYYDSLEPEMSPIYEVPVGAGLNPIGTPVMIAPGTRHQIDPDTRQPVIRQLIAGIEQDIPLGLRLSVHGIYRDADDVVDDVLPVGQGDFVARTISDAGPDGIPSTGDETGATVTAYNQITDPLAAIYRITNPADAFRTYRGLQLTVATSNRAAWQLLASWVLSKTTGTIDNVTVTGTDPEFDSPNADPQVQPLRDGRLTNDSTHVAKVFGLYRAPWGIHVSAAYYFTSGQTFTRTQRVRLNQGVVDLFIEPRGSGRLDAQQRIDARVEKEWVLGGHRVSVLADGFNLANADTVTARVARSGIAYLTPTAVVAPRAFRIGAQYRF